MNDNSPKRLVYHRSTQPGKGELAAVTDFYSDKTFVLLANLGGFLGALFVHISREGASTPSVLLFFLILLS